MFTAITRQVTTGLVLSASEEKEFLKAWADGKVTITTPKEGLVMGALVEAMFNGEKYTIRLG